MNIESAMVFLKDYAAPLGTAIALPVALGALAKYFIQKAGEGRDRRRAEYRSLEFEANALFRFEAEHAAEVKVFRSPLPPAISEEDECGIVVYSYVYQMLNLFEIILSFRETGAVDDEEFLTWVEWFWETCEYPAFRALWIGGVRDHYKPALRSILDAGVILQGCPLPEGDADSCALDPSARLAEECRSLQDFRSDFSGEGRLPGVEELFFGYLAHILRCSKVLDYYRQKEESSKGLPCREGDSERGGAAMASPVAIREAGAADLERCVDFFVANVDAEFISHAELMSGRAVDAWTWSPRLREVLRAELAPALDQDWSQPLPAAASPGTREGLALAEDEGGKLLGLAFYGIIAEGRQRYGMLYDIIVERGRRREGWGPCLLRHVEKRMLEAKVGRLFLESGRRNRRAHRFFKREGFEPISIVMAKSFHD